MRWNGSTRLSLFLILILAGVHAQSQSDSSQLSAALSKANYLYKRFVGVQSGLYNGTEYADYTFRFKEGHPWFFIDKPMTGTVVYDGVRYDSVLLHYNEIADCLVFQDDSHRFQLINERVNAFELAGYYFVRLNRTEAPGSIPVTGFYGVLYNGKLQLLVKETKSIREELKSGDDGVVRYADSKLTYYIKKDNRYFPVNGKKSVYNILADKKKELQQYARSNHLNYKRNRDQMLQQLCAYYDQLTR
jgi:hypothetical protein